MDIQFTLKPLTLSTPDTTSILCMEALPYHPSDLLCITEDQKLWRINCVTAQNKLISTLTDLNLSANTPIQIQISSCLTYAVITRINYDDKNNFGLVIDLQKGERVFELKDYRLLMVLPWIFLKSITNFCFLVTKHKPALVFGIWKQV